LRALLSAKCDVSDFLERSQEKNCYFSVTAEENRHRMNLIFQDHLQ